MLICVSNFLQVDRFSLVYYASTEDEEGLSETVLGLSARAEVTIFPGGGALELRCTATIQERTWATTATAMLARLNNQKLAQDEFSNASGTKKYFLFHKVITINYCTPGDIYRSTLYQPGVGAGILAAQLVLVTLSASRLIFVHFCVLVLILNKNKEKGCKYQCVAK